MTFDPESISTIFSTFFLCGKGRATAGVPGAPGALTRNQDFAGTSGMLKKVRIIKRRTQELMRCTPFTCRSNQVFRNVQVA